MASSRSLDIHDQSPPSDSHNDLPRRTIPTDVDVSVYAAVARGVIIDVFKERRDDLVNFLTPNRNTVLHLHITASMPDEPTGFVEDILKLCPALRAKPNARGETPLHLAARYGHERVVKLLVAGAKAGRAAGDLEMIGGDEEAAKQMLLRATNEEKDTALHEAVRFQHLSIVRLLIKEDPEFSYPANKAGETPLYIAAERKYSELVSEILDNCTSPAVDGPCGRTALHAAVIAKDEASTEKILQTMLTLTRTGDDNGWIPLHYAVDFKYISIVKILLKFDMDAVYVTDKRGRTAHHVAALCGHHKIFKELILHRPGCCELVDDRGCNVLHLAVESSSKKTVWVILKKRPLRHLIYQKNKDGNTPLHHAAALHRFWSLRALMHSKLYSRVDKEAFNDENKNVSDIVYTDDRISTAKAMIRWSIALNNKFGHRILERKDDEDVNWQLDDDDPCKEKHKGKDDPALPVLEKAREASMIAAALIATITFTAGFTLPGGYVSDSGPLQGAAVLRHNTAFKVFMISDTIAMVLSSVAVLLHLDFVMSVSNKQRLENNLNVALNLTTVAIRAMVLAFVTGTYAVLERCDSLANATCVLGLSFFVFFQIWMYRTNKSIYRIRNFGKKKIYYKHP